MTNMRLVARVFLLAVAVQLVALILVVWLLGEALEIRVPLLFHLVAVPVIELVALVPVSFNGFGLREERLCLPLRSGGRHARGCARARP